MKLQDIKALDKKYFINVFGERTPVCFERGEGMKLWDTEGKQYLDFYAGVAVSALGHSHPKLVEAIKSQVDKIIHTSSVYYIESQAKLAQILVENSCADRVFFANSGAEANEAAIKLARIYYKKKGLNEKYEIITLVNSFHGRTLATVAATGQDKFRKPFQPLLPSFKSVPINDIEALENALSDQTCAIMMEPIQGESGVHPVSAEYAKAVRKLCDRLGILLIFDEVQTGLGRTGKLFGYQHFGIEPDIITLAKALGGGVPIGAMCAKQFAADAFEPGDHGSTFGGNPLACTAALAVMNELLDGGLVKNSEKMGEYLFASLTGLKNKYSIISEVRGKGLIIGIQLNVEKAAELRLMLLDKGFVVGNVGSSIIRLLPPLIVTREDIDQLIKALDESLQEIA